MSVKCQKRTLRQCPGCALGGLNQERPMVVDEANSKLLMRMEKPKFLSYLGLPRLLPASKEIRASGPYEKGAFPAELG